MTFEAPSTFEQTAAIANQDPLVDVGMKARRL
jgi:hypothetical protein